MIHVPRVFVSNALFEIRARVVSQLYRRTRGYTGIPGRSINIDTSFFFSLSLFFYIYIYMSTRVPLARLLRNHERPRIYTR